MNAVPTAAAPSNCLCSAAPRWSHAADDFIHTEEDAEVCATMGYTCTRCRPADEPPPHMQPSVDASIVEPDSPAEKSTE